MNTNDNVIDRECAENLRDCIYRLYGMFADARELSKKEGSVGTMVGLNPKVVPVISSAFTFLASRNRDICRDDGLLNAGCKVGLTIGESIKYLQLPDVDVVEIRFNAILIFGALLFTLFLVEVERGAILPDEDNENENDHIDMLKEFLRSISESHIESVNALSMNNIVRVTFMEPNSSAGHNCH